MRLYSPTLDMRTTTFYLGKPALQEDVFYNLLFIILLELNTFDVCNFNFIIFVFLKIY